MHETVRLGRVRGVAIGANWSLFIVVWLMAWGLADGQLPDAEPGAARLEYWVIAVGASLVFFACLLAHELAHSVVARRHGVEVTGIVLWLFGGVSQFAGDPPDADAELRIAIAGPATSLAISAAFLAVATGVDAVVDGGVVVAALGWLAGINLVLAAFNSLPAFPLDGGRILRAWLWRRRGDKVAATLAAAKSGRWFGVLLIAFGVLALMNGGIVGGVWLTFLGWFILSAAEAEASGSITTSRLAGATAVTAMTPHPFTVPADTTVRQLLDGWLFRERCSTFPVTGPDGDVVGLITHRRVRAVSAEAWDRTLVTDVAAPLAEVVTCQADDELAPVLTRMNASSDQRALVFRGDCLVGVISPSDIARVLDRAELREVVGA